MPTLDSLDRHVEQLFGKLRRVAAALSEAGIEYRVVGGLAVYLHVEEVEPDFARLTKDVDLAVARRDLDAIVAAATRYEFEYRHAAGVDMLVDLTRPGAKSAVHLVFVGEKVRPEYLEPVPGFGIAVATPDGILLAPVGDLLKMKLTSFREKDRVHVRDMDGAGLITPEIESGLSPEFLERLARVRATE